MQPEVLKSGLTYRHKLQLLKEQNFICPLCNCNISEDDAVLDHCHNSGYVRSVLHDRCNRALGFIEWAIANTVSGQDFLDNVRTYVDRHSSSPSTLIHPRHNALQKKKQTRRNVRMPRFVIAESDKQKYLDALKQGPMPHPNPKKHTSALGSWKRTSEKYGINHGRLLAYVNGDRPVTELQ